MKVVNGKATAEFFYDSVGRRRKLSDNTMSHIREQFRNGAKVSWLALTYGVSTGLIRTITYDTPRQADMDALEAWAAKRQREAAALDKLRNPGAWQSLTNVDSI